MFIITAFATPAIRFLLKKMPKIKWTFPVIYYMLGVLLLFIKNDSIVSKIILYVSGYIFLSFIGFVLREDWKLLNIYLFSGVIVLACCIAILLCIGGSPMNISGNKYPPTVYYITYGLTVSLTIMHLLSMYNEENWELLHSISTVFISISKLSFDVYLWHVLGLYLTRTMSNVWLRLIVVITVSLAGAKLYGKLKYSLLNRKLPIGKVKTLLW